MVVRKEGGICQNPEESFLLCLVLNCFCYLYMYFTCNISLKSVIYNTDQCFFCFVIEDATFQQKGVCLCLPYASSCLRLLLFVFLYTFIIHVNGCRYLNIYTYIKGEGGNLVVKNVCQVSLLVFLSNKICLNLNLMYPNPSI